MLLKELLKSKIIEKYTKDAEEQKWLGAKNQQQTTPGQRIASHRQPNSEQMENYTWYCLQRKQDHTTTTTTNKDISTKQSRWPSQTPIVECAALLQNQQHMTLYAATHDRMLRPIYHCLLDKYNFQESDHGKPWYQQSLPHAVLENEKAKT